MHLRYCAQRLIAYLKCNTRRNMTSLALRSFVSDRHADVSLNGNERRVTGTFPYGSADIDGVEVILPFAFKRSLETHDVHLFHEHDPLNWIAATHDNSLEITESEKGLVFRAKLDRAIEATRYGVSVGMQVHSGFKDRVSGMNVITGADLHEISIVANPRYEQSTLELRQRGAWISGNVPFRKNISCECQGVDCDDVFLEDSAFDEVLNSDREILAIGDDFSNPLGSRRRGSLVMQKSRGSVSVSLTQRSENSKTVTRNSRIAPVYIRPIIDLERSDYKDVNRVRRFTNAYLRAWLVKGTPAAAGLQPAEVRSNGITLWR